MGVKNYKDLKVWQKAVDLVVECYNVTRVFPSEEKYGLTSQIRRAATSIPANIAEGHGRQHTNEFIHFLGIARGSAKELETHLIVSQRIGFLREYDPSPLLMAAEEISKMLTGLQAALRARS